MSNGARLPKLNVGRRRPLNCLGARRLPAAIKPSFDLRKVPHNAASGEVEPFRKLAALFHIVDGGVSERDQFPELLSTNSPSAGRGRCSHG